MLSCKCRKTERKMETTKTTVLHNFHCANGANMALFGGYDMPLWYKTGAKAEHLSVITSVGMFDTSHMAAVTVGGAGARSLLQYALTKDLEACIGPDKTPLSDGRCVYGLFLNEKGCVIDDAIVYQLRHDSFMVVVNAGMGAVVADHLRKLGQGQEVIITDLTDKVGKMDIQGPNSPRVLQKIVKDPEKLLEMMVYFSFKGGFGDCHSQAEVQLLDGTNLLVSRTGYTGEFGFELFVDVDHLESLWRQVLEAGAEYSIVVCGLAARDSLRAGAVLPLSHQDIGPWPFVGTPWDFAVADRDGSGAFSKDFHGAAALLGSDWNKFTLPFAGFDPRKIGADGKNYVTDSDGRRIGTILTCTTDMAIGRVDGVIRSVSEGAELKLKGLCCGFVLLNENRAPGETVVLTDGKRKIRVEIRKDIRPGRTARRPMAAMVD